ncbi:MAG TPA: TIGR02996 domain-containing protein [Kofleriaceae bacterium]|nr:TIGR02996 domain-containing protein [Kofleriaceae bacterium]
MTAELLQQIFDAPEDDTPRLIYADHLLDRGDPLGELIHMQCALARPRHGSPMAPALWRDGKPLLDTDVELEHRERALLQQHADVWLAPVRPYLRSWAFVRGFPDHVTADAATFLAGVPSFRGRVPISRVGLSSIGNATPAAFDAELPSLRELEISVSTSADERSVAGQAIGRAFFAPVRALTVWGHGVDDQLVRGIAELDQLTSLVAHSCKITGRTLGRLTGLESLTLDSDALRRDWPGQLPKLTRLRSLALGANLDGDRMTALLASGLARLEHLRFDALLADDALLALAAAELPALRSLAVRVHGYQLDREGVRVLRERFGERLEVA